MLFDAVLPNPVIRVSATLITSGLICEGPPVCSLWGGAFGSADGVDGWDAEERAARVVATALDVISWCATERLSNLSSGFDRGGGFGRRRPAWW